MKKSIHTARHRVLAECLIEARKAARLTQQKLGERLSRPQSFVAKYENGERRLDVIEFLQISKILGADAHRIIGRVMDTPEN